MFAQMVNNRKSKRVQILKSMFKNIMYVKYTIVYDSGKTEKTHIWSHIKNTFIKILEKYKDTLEHLMNFQTHQRKIPYESPK